MRRGRFIVQLYLRVMGRACRYYGHNRFLCLPGFADANPPAPAARMACIGQALEWAARGELPPAIPQEKLREMLTRAPSVLDYYRTVYGPLRRESQRLQESFSPHFDAVHV